MKSKFEVGEEVYFRTKNQKGLQACSLGFATDGGVTGCKVDDKKHTIKEINIFHSGIWYGITGLSNFVEEGGLSKTVIDNWKDIMEG